MGTQRTLRLVWLLGSGVILAAPVPASSSFDLDYVVIGRIWVPSLVVDVEGLPKTNRVVALPGFGSCATDGLSREQLLEPHDRDCRFEQQLHDALVKSGMFRRVVRVPAEGADVDLTVSPQRSRVQFRRQVIPAVKPFLVFSFFTYLWTPLPFEVDVESYDLRVAILDPHGQPVSEIGVAREFSHDLSSYSAEQTAPEDLLAQFAPNEEELGRVVVCRGPHAGVAVQEFLQKVGAAAMGIVERDHTVGAPGRAKLSDAGARGRPAATGPT